MLLLKDISKQYSGRAILDNITLTLSKKRTALIGKNGSGKSTLMKIIAGLEYCDSGRIVTQKNAVIEYLPQYSLYNFRGSIYEEVLARLNSDKIQTLSDEKTKIIQKLESSGEPNENLLIRLDEIVEEIQALELKIKQKNSVETLLLNLGFNKEDWDKKAGTLSGGWQMRLALARVLVREPDIILLDEPTNYLDIIAIKFLKDWLKNFKGELIVVSHDRDFLNGVVEETWEIFNGEIAVFRGNYDYYLAEKEQRLKVLKRRREKQLDEIKSLQDYCDKNRFNAAHAALAQSKQKQLERLKSDLVVLPKTPPAMTFNLPTPKRGGEIVVEMDKISHNFGELKVISNYKRIISRGERVALVGRNGFGKSTLMNIIGQELVPTSGICKIGKEIEICYFRQHEIATLPQNMTVIEFVESIAPFDMMTKVKSILACFLFYEEEWDKKIAVLSGGEKVRLAFIKFILTPGNLLLLDEPTTHLDIDSKEILLKTLQNIPATIVFVSHDSYFINSLATSVVYFKGRCDFVNFPGNFKEYLDLYGDETVEEEEETRKESDLTAIKGKRDFARQKERRNATNKLKKDIDEIQNSIDEKEREKENLLNKIIKSPNDYKLAKELSDIDDEILALMEDWEEKSEKLEKIREGER